MHVVCLQGRNTGPRTYLLQPLTQWKNFLSSPPMGMNPSRGGAATFSRGSLFHYVNCHVCRAKTVPPEFTAVPPPLSLWSSGEEDGTFYM